MTVIVQVKISEQQGHMIDQSINGLNKQTDKQTHLWVHHVPCHPMNIPVHQEHKLFVSKTALLQVLTQVEIQDLPDHGWYMHYKHLNITGLKFITWILYGWQGWIHAETLEGLSDINVFPLPLTHFLTCGDDQCNSLPHPHFWLLVNCLFLVPCICMLCFCFTLSSKINSPTTHLLH